jgi:hypothetical protein
MIAIKEENPLPPPKKTTKKPTNPRERKWDSYF